MSDVLDRVKKIVVENLDVDGDKVVEGASFIDDLGADSLDLGLELRRLGFPKENLNKPPPLTLIGTH